MNLHQLNHQVENIVNDFLKPMPTDGGAGGSSSSRSSSIRSSSRRSSAPLRAASVEDKDGSYFQDEEDPEALKEYAQHQIDRAQRQQRLQDYLRNHLLPQYQQQQELEQQGSEENTTDTDRAINAADHRKKALEGLNARRLPLVTS